MNVSDDFDIFDNVESVIFVHKNRDNTATSYPGVWGLQRVTNTLPAPGSLLTLPGQTVWHLKIASMPHGVIPARGDRIIGASGTWEVISDSVETLGARYKVQTVRATS